jgi:hypothetical protein
MRLRLCLLLLTAFLATGCTSSAPSAGERKPLQGKRIPKPPGPRGK